MYFYEDWKTMGLSFTDNQGAGRAKQFFCEQDPQEAPTDLQAAWPHLQQMVEAERIAYLDLMLARHILGKEAGCDEEAAAFLCHLSAAARDGHLFVEVAGDSVVPDPALSWLQEGDDVDANAVSRLRKMVAAGSEKLAELKLYEQTSPVICLENRYYLYKNFHYEQEALRQFHARLETAPDLELDLDKAEAMIERMVAAKQLLPEQAEAIRTACRHTLGIISGGPGTGKTYTAGLLIKVFWQCLPEEKRKQCRIALAAPTGKAAANLQKSLTNATKQIPELADLQAKTLHGLLGIRSKSQSGPDPLNVDLLLVDESSMIDVRMMGFLLQAVKSGSRLILLGDPHQLPPVEAGALFGEMIEKMKERAATLNTCMRADLQEIVQLAAAVNTGRAADVLALLKKSAHVSLQTEGSLKNALSAALERFPCLWDGSRSPQSFFEAYQQFRLLSPLRKKEMGVEAVNRWFVKELKKRVPRGKWFAAPIMIAYNDYQLNLFNGEVGVLFMQSRDGSSFQKGDFALFSGHETRVPALLLPKFEYAYCLSVHKSQGSEFDEVLLLMPDGSEVFGRKGIYTAVTRAKRKLTLFGSEAVLQRALAS